MVIFPVDCELVGVPWFYCYSCCRTKPLRTSGNRCLSRQQTNSVRVLNWNQSTDPSRGKWFADFILGTKYMFQPYFFRNFNDLVVSDDVSHDTCVECQSAVKICSWTCRRSSSMNLRSSASCRIWTPPTPRSRKDSERSPRLQSFIIHLLLRARIQPTLDPALRPYVDPMC